MNGLVQYGVGRGSLGGTVVIDTDAGNPAPETLDQPAVISQLKKWITGPTPVVTPTPALNEDNLCYFIFPPTTAQLTQDGLNGDTDFCGYHFWDKVNPSSTNSDLFFGIVSTKSAKANSVTDRAFVESLSACISHELAELFSDRDSAGYVSAACTNPDKTSETCEIGDICESAGNFSYQRTGSPSIWSVEQYWSNWENSCIHGNKPVSLKAFLRAINFDFTKGLKSLGTPTINLQFIASQMV
jgi:hypothetical protein